MYKLYESDRLSWLIKIRMVRDEKGLGGKIILIIYAGKLTKLLLNLVSRSFSSMASLSSTELSKYFEADIEQIES
jgi:hypothetical protein